MLLSDLYHAMTWPSLSYVAEDAKGRIVGYVLAKMLVPCPYFTAFSFQNSNGGADASGKKILLLEMNRMDT
jgi:hypothetical protein